MQLQTLKIYCDLVELGSFSAAGARNRITQSAVSQQIRALEASYGVTFFERANKKFLVTPEGRIFEHAAREILALVKHIPSRLRESSGVVAGGLRISTVYSIGLHDLPRRLKAFRAEHPEVQVQVEYKRASHIYEDVLSGRADIGLVPYPRSGGGINADIFDEDELVVVCPAGHRLAKKKRIKLRELQGENFVAFDPDTATSKAINHALRDHQVSFAQRHEFDDIETVKQAVEVAGVISIVPRRTVEKEDKDGRLCVIRIEDAELKRPLGIIRKQGKVTSPALREFVRAMGVKKLK
ncbi:MAG: LysR family transcriptional regulator [Verrucomicrobia bacterium]|nr:LysR family transcriptional regulator [Verrucomicrobiota bacterium]